MLPTEAMEPCLDASRRSSEAATWAYEAIRRLKPTPRQRKDQAAMLPYTTAALTQSLLARCDVVRRFEIRTAQNDEWQQAENPSSEREEYGENPPLDMPPVENLKRNRQAKPAPPDVWPSAHEEHVCWSCRNKTQVGSDRQVCGSPCILRRTQTFETMQSHAVQPCLAKFAFWVLKTTWFDNK